MTRLKLIDVISNKPQRQPENAIRKHTFPISILVQSLKEIGNKISKIESENVLLTSIKGHNSGLIKLTKFTYL